MKARVLLACLVVLLVPASLNADGKFWPEAAYPAEPTIPLQRAIIVFDNGVETLIVESSFESDSPSVGWVLPLPAEPTKLEVAEPDMCRSLSASLTPLITYNLSDTVGMLVPIAGLIAACAAVVIGAKKDGRWKWWVGLLGFGILLLLTSLPTLGLRSDAVAGSAALEVLSSRRVGNYEVAVLRAEKSGDLSDWLSKKSFVPLDHDGAAVVDDYIARNWCFVVARLLHDGAEAATPHPIAATFPVEAPIYPMKLTGLSGSTTRVELFVIAGNMASADDFTRESADAYHLTPDPDNHMAPWYSAGEVGLRIGSPDVGALMWEGCAVTKLIAEMTPDEMDRDVAISLEPLKPQRQRVYTARGRLHVALIILLCGAIVTMIALAVVFRNRRQANSAEKIGAGALAGLVLASAGVFYLSATVIEVKTRARRYSTIARPHLRMLTLETAMLVDEGKLDADTDDTRLRTLPELLIAERALRGEWAVNPYTGEPLKFERSPGNFSVRIVGGEKFICFYDGDCREYRVKLPPKPVDDNTTDPE